MRGRVLTVAFNGKIDLWNRQVVTSVVDGNGVGELGVAAGHRLACVVNGSRITRTRPAPLLTY